jgi:aryl-alcohol dehydrogenase-like predicted oxidoreductase
VHPVTAVQNEYSLWTRYPELGMLQTCRELGVTFVPFSPLARGMLSDTFPVLDNFAETDFRQNMPRFMEPNFSANCKLISAFRDFAHSRGWSTTKAALAWVLEQGEHLVPIPGTRSAAHLQEWVGAAEINFNDEDRAEIERILPVGFAHGDRYSDEQIVGVERYC